MLFIEIIGNLGADPEERFTADGKQLTSIRVAVNSRHKDANGEQIERTDWFRARMGGGRADYAARELHKGSRVLVRGRLEIGEYNVKNTGEMRTTYDIWADAVINLSSREGLSREEAPRAEPTTAHVGASSRPAGEHEAADDDGGEPPF
jgi:single-strand DNA-binding protein